MIEFLQNALGLIVTLSILVTIHEFGHYWVARLCNVHVLRFSVGFGKPFFMRRGPAPAYVAPPEDQVISTRANEPLEGTEFALAAIPLGGYVKMLDEREGFVADDQKHLAFNRKSVWQRIAITAAGPAANFLLAIVVYWFLFSVGITGLAPKLAELDETSVAAQAGLKKGHRIVAVDGTPTASWGEVNMQLFARLGHTGDIQITAKDTSYASEGARVFELPVSQWLSSDEQPNPATSLGLKVQRPFVAAVIGEVVPDTVAAKVGLVSGDKIIAIDNKPINAWTEMVTVVQANPAIQLTFEILRAGAVIQIVAAPGSKAVNGEAKGYLGVGPQLEDGFMDEFLVTVRYPVYTAWIYAIEETWDLTAFTFASIGKLVTGAISPKNISGPITIAQVATDSAKSGFENFIRFIALVSVSLGVINLLPIPVLDGGHLLYYLVELVFRRPVPERVQVWGLQFGLFLIASLTVLAFYNDLMRL